MKKYKSPDISEFLEIKELSDKIMSALPSVSGISI